MFSRQAKLRAEELGVADLVQFIHDDATGFVAEERVDVAACLGATWIGGGFAGTIELLSKSLRTDGIILIGDLGYDVVEMVLADQDSWDRYEAAKWLTMRRWLKDNPDDELANEVREQLRPEPARYATYTREYLGWGVFALIAR